MKAAKKPRVVEVGDRFEDTDARQGTRVVRIVDVQRWTETAWYVVEVAERNPDTVGDRKVAISFNGLRMHYNQVSR